MWTRASLWCSSSPRQGGWWLLSSSSFAQLCGLDSISVPRTGLQTGLWSQGKRRRVAISKCSRTGAVAQEGIEMLGRCTDEHLF